MIDHRRKTAENLGPHTPCEYSDTELRPPNTVFAFTAVGNPWQLQRDHAAPSGPSESNCIAMSH